MSDSVRPCPWDSPGKNTGIIIWSSNFTSEHTPKRMKLGSQGNIHIPMFIAALFTVAKKWKKPKSTDRRMDKQNGVYIHTMETLFHIKNGGNTVMCYSKNKPWGHYAKWSKPITKILYDFSDMWYFRVVKFMETENRQMVSRDWRKRERIVIV